MFPALQGKELELAGFVWFQGFNDMFGDYAPHEYEANMKQFIIDLRKDFNVPNLPVVIGALGQHGSGDPSENMKKVQVAQMAMNQVAEFKGNVKSIYTHTLVDKEAERVFPGWQDHFEEWEKVGSDRPYHYLGSAIWFNRIGHAFADEMLVLLKNADVKK
jgi:alpha-galactosidase